jgi:hypothetical protein
VIESGAMANTPLLAVTGALVGMKQPVLVSRRLTPLAGPDLQQFTATPPTAPHSR